MSDHDKIVNTLDELVADAKLIGEDGPDAYELAQDVVSAVPVLEAVARLVRALVAANTTSGGTQFGLPDLRWDGNRGMIYINMANADGDAWFPLELGDTPVPLLRVRGCPALLAIPEGS